MPEAVPDDSDTLMLRAVRGDRAAFAALFEREAGRLIAIARRIVRRTDLAEEVVQDAFVAAWQRSAQFDASRGPARAWLTTIVRNRALNLIRDGSRVEYHDEATLADLGERTAGEGDAAYAQLTEREALRVCLARLEDQRRRAILLSYVEGLSHGEVAATLRAPLGTVKAWIRRGVIALQECMS
jgi:RNA polymerase sigma-70 factor (ECF subfamily)